MSSSQPFIESSPVSPRSVRRRKSRFTFKHLSQLSLYSTTCPLRVIAHIDLDAFYAQCEMVRLGVAEDQPLAVQQWQGLIAVNYAAKKHGIGRFSNIAEAQKICPDIILQHVATWREGDEKWAYHDDAAKHIATHKVSLDPYREQSRIILSVIKEALPPPPLQRVEKASIDEMFLDLSAQVHSILLERYPELRGPPPYDDPTEQLPAPPTTALDWNADGLVDLDDDQTEEDDPDWDDVAMLVGSEIVREVRQAVRDRLKYTCSGGLSRNKMIAKLGSGYKKPNQQTIVRNRAVQHFLGEFQVSKVRMLGGKLGDEVISTFNTDTIKELREVPLDQLKKLGEGTGQWLYHLVRGEDQSEVSPRTQIKSMLSAKSFQPHINTFEQAVKWLRIFVADIFSRLVEEGVVENKRRPKTINLHHRQGGQTRSKQAPIPQGKAIDEALLFDLAKNLLAQIIVDGRAWPCGNLSLSVGGFEDGVTGNRGIGGFLVRGDEAKALHHSRPSEEPEHEGENGNEDEHFGVDTARPEKRRRANDGRINKFFPVQDSERDPVDFDSVPSAQREGPRDDELDGLPRADESDSRPFQPEFESSQPSGTQENAEDGANLPNGSKNSYQHAIDKFFCSRCQKSLLLDQKEEHEDWHFAMDLQDQDSRSTNVPDRPQKQPTPKAQKPSKGRSRPPHGGQPSKMEKGQRRLAFGS